MTAEERTAAQMVVRRRDGTEIELDARQAELVELVLGDTEMVSPQQASVMLSVSRPMVMRWIQEGLLEDRPVGSHHKIPVAAVWALKAARAEHGRRARMAVRSDDGDDPQVAAARRRAEVRIARRRPA